ncbi:MAG TPA: tetratricopeptide repeat protein [Flavobacteriales bacterium]|nr:tetratricopeptide repeat protein [Flavobacteriales bacterium]
MPDDTTKALTLSDLCFAYRRTHADSAELFGQAALRLARKLRFTRGEAQALNDLAILRIDRSAYDEADSLLRLSLALRVQLHDSAGMAAVHNKLGIIHQERFMLEDALEEDLKALAIYERTGPPAHEATLLNNIAILQFNLKQMPRSLATHRRAAAIREAIGDKGGLAASYGNMANVEVLMGDTASAMDHYNEAIRFFRTAGSGPELAVQLHNLASIEVARGQLEQAAQHYTEALTIRTASGDRKAMASSMAGLGGVRLDQGRISEARNLLLQALHISHGVDARREGLQALLDLARLHARLNQGDSTLLYYGQYAALKDSIFNADLGARLAEAEVRFETGRKERQILAQRAAIAELEAQSEHRKLLLVLLPGAALLVLLGFLLFTRARQHRQRAAHDAAIIRERESGMQGMLQATESERKRIARELHDGIGQQLTGLKLRLEEIADQMLRGRPPRQEALAEALSITHGAGSEVRAIAHALMPQALEKVGLVAATDEMLRRTLQGTETSYSLEQFGLRQRLPPAMEVALFRIVQELVQNTQKHAHARHVGVQFLVNKGHLVLIYEDDGRGLGAVEDRGAGIGLLNIRERAHALQGSFTMGKGAEQGMVATVRIPLPEPASGS